MSPGRGGYVESLSRREDRHVYAGGFGLRPGFVITLGNTVNRAGRGVARSERGRRLVTDHEHVHVWQARWLGPLYPLLYVLWSVVGSDRRGHGLDAASPGATDRTRDRVVRLLPQPARVVGLQPRRPLAASRSGGRARLAPSTRWPDQPGFRPTASRERSSASVKASGASCWVQWPTPSSTIAPR